MRPRHSLLDSLKPERIGRPTIGRLRSFASGLFTSVTGAPGRDFRTDAILPHVLAPQGPTWMIAEASSVIHRPAIGCAACAVPARESAKKAVAARENVIPMLSVQRDEHAMHDRFFWLPDSDRCGGRTRNRQWMPSPSGSHLTRSWLWGRKEAVGSASRSGYSAPARLSCGRGAVWIILAPCFSALLAELRDGDGRSDSNRPSSMISAAPERDLAVLERLHG